MSSGIPALPAGTVAFVFTDIEGSTRLLRDLGDDYGPVLLRHHELLRHCWAAHGGREIDQQGDSTFVAFADAGLAVAACLAAQRALGAESWRGGAVVRVRMGVHAGLAAPLGERYVALAVHQAARVAELGHGGQVLVSQDAADLLDAEQSAALSLLGRYRIRDFEQAVGIFQAAEAGMQASFPALRALPADRHNLPLPSTRLVGRQADLMGLAAAVRQHRLVCLVGPGGVGKTRLATEYAIGAADRWPDGVWLVECGVLQEPGQVRPAIAAALGVGGDDGAVTWTEVLAHLSTRRLLLVLDGCERHAGAVGAVVASLLASCPGVAVLATGTERLHVPAEAVRRLEPLGLVGGLDSPAVELFLERARAAWAGFDVDADTGPLVIAVCRRLDGLPLAIEIAAAKTTVLHPGEILQGLDRRFAMLREQGETRPERQRTIQGLLDWSVRLLHPDEAAALARVCLLPEGFDLATAGAAVAAGGVEADSVPMLIWSLVEKSLVVADPAAGGTRYRLLETVRAYARDLLDSRGETAGTAARVTGYFLDTIGPARGTSQLWVNRMSAELTNVREVLAAGAGDEPAQQLACSVARYHDAVQSYREGITETARLLDLLAAPTPARVGLLTALGDLHMRVGDVAMAARCADEAGALQMVAGAPAWDDVGVAKLRGEVALARRQPELAIELARAALERRLSPRGRARMCNLWGIAAATVGDAETAAAAFGLELAAAGELGDEILLAHAHGNSAEIALRRGQVDVAAVHQAICLGLAVAIGRVAMVAYALLATSRIAVAQKVTTDEDWAVALRLATKAERLLAETGAALYDTDRQVADAFGDAARVRLGAAASDVQVAAGEQLDIEVAVASAQEILTRAGRSRNQHVTETEDVTTRGGHRGTGRT